MALLLLLRRQVLPMSVCRLQIRWKEKSVRTGPRGILILELPMGILSAYLPPEDIYRRKTPARAHGFWPTLRIELAEWSTTNKAEFY
jgi:hypothetical protein